MNNTHSFPASFESRGTALRHTVDNVSLLSQPFGRDLSVDFDDAKFGPVIKNHNGIQATIPIADPTLHSTLASLRNIPSSLTSDALYPEDIPIAADSQGLADWCLSRFEHWGSSAGMETFKEIDTHAGSHATVVLGGKVLVVDVDLDLKAPGSNDSLFRGDTRSAQSKSFSLPTIRIASLKTSYALDGTTTTNGNSDGLTPGTLDFFLKHSVDVYLHAVHRGTSDDPPGYHSVESGNNSWDNEPVIAAARFSRDVKKHLKYLMMLDKLASSGEGGIRWFRDADRLSEILDNVAKEEANRVAASLTLTRAPLDIFLARAHGLPLPFVVAPAISFLVYLSPSAYLQLLRTNPSAPGFSNGRNAAKANTFNGRISAPNSVSGSDYSHVQLDISSHHLRTAILTHGRLRGATVASLVLIPSDHPSRGALANESDLMDFDILGGHAALQGRPTFPLFPGASAIDHVFPQHTPPHASNTEASADITHLPPSAPTYYSWYLDFTSGGRCDGVVISQARMRSIEALLNRVNNPFSGGGGDVSHMEFDSLGGLGGMGLGNMSGFGMGGMGVGQTGMSMPVNSMPPMSMDHLGFGLGGVGIGGIGMTGIGMGLPFSAAVGMSQPAAPCWLDMLLNPGKAASEWYRAVYRSPSDAHPPLHLRLTSPGEPGIILERVPVRNIKEVWAILEIVKEQCWLNETLKTVQWTPEETFYSHIAPQSSQMSSTAQYTSRREQPGHHEANVSEQTLSAVLSGALTPRFIPVNVHISSRAFWSPSAFPGVEIPSHSGGHDSLFDSPLEMDMAIPGLSDSPSDPTSNLPTHGLDPLQQPFQTAPVLVLTSPERLPITGNVEFRVCFDTSRPRGVVVELSGAPGTDMDVGIMEEVCRRGGVFGLPGRLWKRET